MSVDSADATITPMNKPTPFNVGNHLSVYLWAGPGTIRMNRLKFMGAPVDEAVHMRAHTAEGATILAKDTGFSWAYLMYDWGFPPEIEKEDWLAFKKAVPVFHKSGMKVFGYIQTSNCVYDGSFKAKDWYAQDPKGRPFYYYTGRYMTCWLHPEWREHLRQITRGVVEAGADGVFYDNPWHASQTFLLGGAWLGTAGCFCPRCQESFRKVSGSYIPTLLSPENDTLSQAYLRWRTDLVAQTIGEMGAYARSLNKKILVSVNDFDAVMRPSTVIFGIDLQKMAKVQDVLMIEDYGLPRWEETGKDQPLLVNNAITLHTAHALAGGIPVSTNPYDKGIGFDTVYPARRLQQGIAEAAAAGCPMVVKGTEYVEKGEFTLLTAKPFAPQRKGVKIYHSWLNEHQALFLDRKNLARIAVLHPGDKLWQRWNELAGIYFGICQTLTAARVPWKVVTVEEQIKDIDCLITMGGLPKGVTVPKKVKVVDACRLTGWEPGKPGFLGRNRWLRRPVSWFVTELYRSYFRSRLARNVLDSIGMVHFFLQSPYFRLPPKTKQQALVEALMGDDHMVVQSEAPLLVEHWQRGRQEQIHLVNYAAQPQRVTVKFRKKVKGKIVSPDTVEVSQVGEQFELDLDVYSVILVEK